jgi:palmitoyltransferase
MTSFHSSNSNGNLHHGLSNSSSSNNNIHLGVVATSPSSAGDGRRPSSTRRVFAWGNWRFRIQQLRILDACIDGAQWALEGLVYLIGPLLIGLALGIVSLLIFVYVTILLPMLQLKYTDTPGKTVLLALHTAYVTIVTGNVLYNYALCVVTRNAHPPARYAAVVRELAAVTDFCWPETPAQVTAYKHDFEDKMILRIRRRQRLATSPPADEDAVGLTQRRTTTAVPSSPSVNAPAVTPGSSGSNQPVRQWMLMGPFEWGFCPNSYQPKPPRSHYDHVTKTLVLNLDHYCPWMFNAIGYFNYRYFVNFMIYIFLGMVYGTALTLQPFLYLHTDEFRTHSREERAARDRLPRPYPMMPHRDEKMLVSLAFMLCLAVGIAVAILGGFHVYLVLTGQTTIEFHANWAAQRRARKEGHKFKNPYNQGWRKNWQQVYGTTHWWLAFWPSTRQPEFLPVPVPGKDTRRRNAVRPQRSESLASFEVELSEPPIESFVEPLIQQV